MHRLVLADDSLTIHKVVELSFAGQEVEVRSFTDGISALEYLREHPADVVVADVSLPLLNGYDLCEEVKRKAWTADIPVILLSGTFEVFDRSRAEQSGCYQHLKKPFETTRLVDMVTRLLAERPSPATERLPRAVAVDDAFLFDIPLQEIDFEPVFELSPEQCRAAPTRLSRDPVPVGGSAGLDRVPVEAAPARGSVPAESEAPPSPILPESLPEQAPPLAEPHSTTAGSLSEEELDLVVQKIMERLPGEIRRLIPEVAAELQRPGG